MQKAYKPILAWAILCGSLLAIMKPAEAGIYTSTGIKATVVDADTGKPLSGVVVLALWTDITPSLALGYTETASYRCNSLVNVIGTTSGADGKFDIPGWVGKLGDCVYIPAYSPGLLLYKPGYAMARLENSGYNHDDYLPSGIPNIPRYNGQTIKLNPLGPHYLIGAPYLNFGEDNYVHNLKNYSDSLGFLQIQKPSKCYWDQVRQALLTLMQEERRLSPYAKQPLQLFDAELSNAGKQKGTEWTCGDQKDYIAGIRAEADKVQPDQPLPFTLDEDYKPATTEDSTNQICMGPQGDQVIQCQTMTENEYSVPREDDPRLQDQASRELANHAIVYHVNIDPENPFFVHVLKLVPNGYSRAGIMDPASGGRIINNPPEDWTKLRDGDIKDYHCADFSDANVRDMYGTTVYYQGCSSIAALTPPPDNIWFNDQVTLSPQNYETKHKRWRLTEFILPRSKDSRWLLPNLPLTMDYRNIVNLPEYVEIDSKVPVSVTTDLEPAGQHRWVLPPFGIPFDLNVSLGGTTDGSPNQTEAAPQKDICDDAMPTSAVVALALAVPGFQVAKARDFPASQGPYTSCPSVLAGRFTEDGPGYVAILEGRAGNKSMTIAAVTPKDQDWDVEKIDSYPCRGDTFCRLTLAKPGAYSLLWNIPNYWWNSKNMPEVLVLDHDGVFIDGPGPGMNHPMRTLSGFEDGKWQTIYVDTATPSPGATSTHAPMN